MDQHSPAMRALSTVLREILDGSSPDSGWLLNPGDRGLLRSLDALSAEEASALGPGGRSSIAAHVDHLRYGVGLLNRWSKGENPWGDADWAESWEHTSVTAQEWEALRARLREEAGQWQANFAARTGNDEELATVVGNIAHLAYHLGAIRQISQAARGPGATEG